MSVEGFETHRPRLLRLAHRMLGSMGDAEDVVQEAYLRWHRADDSTVRSPEAWLVTVVTRLAIDRLRTLKSERELYVGQWLPEPWMQGQHGSAAESSDPAQRGTDLEYAVLVLLERLAPEERAAFLLREVFEVDYALVAKALGREEAACRQMVHRARERVAEGRPARAGKPPGKAPTPPTPEEKMDLLRRFRAASETGDAATLAGLLAPNATYTADGGGKVFAARSVLEGAGRIERLITTLARKAGDDVAHALVWVDGEPALATFRGERPFALTFIAADEDGIVAIYRIFNPDKLRRLPEASAGGQAAG